VLADALGVLQIDAQGKAHTPPLALGASYLFGSAKQGAHAMMWNVRVDVNPGANSVTLDQRNGVSVN
jgi:hypothetical protein